jgi:cyclin A
MRCILVDWLVEVAQEYRLTSDTLHLTLNLLDRFLSVESIVREELQLAGIACMWVASKFEEIYAPTARNFCYITDNTYDQQQLVAMEARLLSALNFTLAVPTAKTFQRRYLQAAAADEELHYLAAFLLELTLMDETLLPYLPSQLAAASVYLAHIMLNRKPWSGTLAHYARYSETEVRLVAQELASTHARILTEGQFGAIREKYSSEKLLSVAAVPICQTMLTPQTINFLQLLLSESRDSLSGATGSIDMELV